MKKIFTSVASLFLLVFLLNQNLWAQNCVIDTNNTNMIWPTANDSIPCVERNTPYTATMQFFCPPQIAGFTIDSIIVNSFSNMPNGINYSCTNCRLYPWSRACVLFYGTTTDAAGDYPITYSGTAYTSGGTASFNWLQDQGVLPEYSFKVIDQGEQCRAVDTTATGIANVNAVKFNVFPNPSTGKLVVDLVKFETAEVTITDLVGRVVYNTQTTGSNGRVYADLTKEAKGIYLVRVHTASGIATKKISIE